MSFSLPPPLLELPNELSYRGVDCIIFVFRREKKKPDRRFCPVSPSEMKLP